MTIKERPCRRWCHVCGAEERGWLRPSARTDARSEDMALGNGQQHQGHRVAPARPGRGQLAGAMSA